MTPFSFVVASRVIVRTQIGVVVPHTVYLDQPTHRLVRMKRPGKDQLCYSSRPKIEEILGDRIYPITTNLNLLLSRFIVLRCVSLIKILYI